MKTARYGVFAVSILLLTVVFPGACGLDFCHKRITVCVCGSPEQIWLSETKNIVLFVCDSGIAHFLYFSGCHSFSC